MGVSVFPAVTFPPGMVTPYAGATAPDGWLLCDGSAVSRTLNANLFAAIGTAYGAGDGSTTFNLPNLKGKVIAGVDAVQSEFATRGTTGGSKSSTSPHTHTLSHTHTMANHTHTLGTHWHGLEQHLHDLQNHGHTVNSHAHGGGTGVHAHSVLNEVYSTNNATHAHNGGGAQYAESPGTGSAPAFGTVSNTNSVGQGNTAESPGTGGPSINNTGWYYAPQGAGGPNGGSDGPSNNTSDGASVNTTSDSSVTAASGNLPPYMSMHYIIKI